MAEEFKTSPIGFLTAGQISIPVFSHIDEYVQNYDQISKDHLNHFENHGVNPFMAEDFWVDCEDRTAAIVKHNVSHGARILDVGCGLGRLLTKCSGYEKYGMDISAQYLEKAIDSDANLCMAKVEDMPYVDDFFDLVVCTDVLEHVLDLNLAMRQLIRVLKPGGKLVLRVPYKESLKPYTEQSYPYKYAHLRNFDEHGMLLLCENIFGQSVEGYEYGPYIVDPGYLRIPIKGRGVGFLFRTLMRIARVLSERKQNWLISKLLKPVEFHAIIKKLK